MLSGGQGESDGPELVIMNDGDATAGWVYDGPGKDHTRAQTRYHTAR